MGIFMFRAVRTAFILFLAVLVSVRPAMAQSILRDAETEAFFDEISAPLIEAAGLDPKNVDIILINDKSVNAFVAGGQAVYLHSGLIDAATSANEVQGVIAHELDLVITGSSDYHGTGKLNSLAENHTSREQWQKLESQADARRVVNA